MDKTLLLTNLITEMVITPAPYYSLPSIVPGPGITLTNRWITISPDRRTGLPGTPREGEILTNEEVEVRPCFAAVYPACPGHAHTNLTRWRWVSGAWERMGWTNSVPGPIGTNPAQATNGAAIFWSGSQLTTSNFLSGGGMVQFGDGSATNITIRMSEEAREKALLELFRKVAEALQP